MNPRAATLRAARSLLALSIGVVGLATLPATPASAAPTTCGGVVFQDYDADGERSEDYSYISPEYAAIDDDGVAGLTVTVTDAQGDTFTDTTDTDGVWSVALDTNDFPIRVDITGYPSSWSAGPVGPDSATLNQFITNPADCTGPFDGTGPVGNASVSAPGSFCDNRPDFVTSCFLFGNFPDHDSQAAVVSLIDGSIDDLSTSSADWRVDEYTTIATLGEVGTVYGVANRPQDGSTYVASFVKRHTKLGPTNNPTTIYRVGPSGTSAWFTVDGTATDPHSGDTDGWLNDFASFDDVGRSGLGDLEISPDGNTLYTVDLGNRQLVRIPINADGSANTSGVSRTNITASSLGVAGTCAADDVRPFGLGFSQDGELLVGAVCSGESTVDAASYPADIVNGPHLGDQGALDAWVFTFNGSSFGSRIDVPLPTTSRGAQNGVTSGDNAFRGQSDWRPWVTQSPFQVTATGWPAGGVAYAQPVLADIEIDGDDLIIGFMDLWGHQNGSNAFVENYDGGNGGAPYQVDQPLSSGDTLRAVANGSGGFTFPTSGPDFFYTGDNYQTSHQETTLGSSAQIPGRPYTVTNSFDPVEASNTWQSGGLEWFDNSGLGSLTAGDHVRGYRLYDGNDGSPVGTFEKAAGIGDLEATCGVAPIEVGNYLWHDANNNGIADPGETPLAGVTIELVNASGTVVDTMVTNAAGEYLFPNLTQGAVYSIRIAATNYDNGNALGTGGTYEGITAPTTTDAGSNDGIDSDATLVGSLPTISFTATVTDHTMDIGLIEPAAPLRLGNTVFIDEDGNGSQNGTEPGVAGVEVQLWSVDASGNPVAIVATDTTDSNGRYVFSDLAAADYILAIADTEQAAGQPLNGFVSTTGNGTAPDPDNNVDLDDNGDAAPGFASISAPVSLSQGDEPTGEAGEGGFVDADSNLTVDFGFTPTLRIGNLVWNDVNDNGVADAGEAPIAGVEVQLWTANAAGDPVAQIATDTTDAAGQYLFDGLDAGRYVVAIADTQQAAGEALEGLATSTGNDPAPAPNDGTDNDDNGTAATGFAAISSAVDLDASAPTGETDGLTGTADEDGSIGDARSDLTVDFGFNAGPPPATFRLGNTVFIDEDGNGSQNGTEPGVAGVEVQLWSVDAAGNPVTIIGTDTTDADGEYLFSDLAAGDYIVAIADAEQASGEALDGYVSTNGNGTAPDPDDNVDLDDNGDAAPGFASISPPVTLSEGDEPTGENGEGGFIDADSNLTVDFGFTERELRLGNLVWNDVNNNGIADAGEAPIAGVEVQLWSVDAAGNPVAQLATDTTDAAGQYLFEGLTAGDYVVAIGSSQAAAGAPLDGMTTSTGNNPAPAPTDGTDNDDNGTAAAGFAAISDVVTLDATAPTGETDGLTGADDEADAFDDNASDLTVDFGFYGLLSLGDTVFADEDGNGSQNDAEPGIAGVEVQLWTADADGNPIAQIGTTITDAAGDYAFTNLPAGDYIVAIADTQQAGGAPLDGLASTTGNGTAPDPDDDVDADDNGDPAPGFASIAQPITLTVGSEMGPLGSDNPTVDFGFLAALELGNLVWFDVNNDGIHDAGEAGAAGVTVELLGADGSVLATTVTDAAGNYLFTDIAPGTYTVRIPASNFVAGGPLAGWHTSTGPASSTDANDDVDENNDGIAGGTNRTDGVVSSPVTLTGNNEPTDEVDESTTATDGNSNLSVDFGVYQVSIGDEVWFDLDNDGIRDADELPAAGVTLELLDEDGNPVLGPDGQPMTTVSDANGNYTFDGLPEGTYVIRIPASNFADGAPLAGVVTSTGNNVDGSAPDPDDDVNADDNGNFIPEGGALAEPITITAGDEPGDVANPTVDFGFTPAAGLGNKVFIDTDRDGIQDAGEPGVPGVIVTVTDVDTGTVVATVTTDTNGGYQVNGLPPGRYTVTFTDPQGRSWTSTDAGSDDAVDSDVSTTGTTGVIVLDAGEFDPTIDAGIVIPRSTTPSTNTTTTTTTSTTSTLAFTGSNLTTGLALGALVMIMIGGGFVLVARRREEDEAV